MKSSFSNIVQKAERKNRNALVCRALLANRIAKSARGFSRRNSYSVKAKALYAIVEKFPNEVEIREDSLLPEMVVVSLLNTNFGLHTPRSALKSQLQLCLFGSKR